MDHKEYMINVEDEDGKFFRKDDSVLKHIDDLSKNFTQSMLKNDLEQAAITLLLWGSKLYPLIEDCPKIKTNKIENVEYWQKKIRTSNLRLDKFIDSKKTVISMRIFNNFLWE